MLRSKFPELLGAFTSMGAGAFLLWMTLEIYIPHRACPRPAPIVSVPAGHNALKIARILHSYGIVRHSWCFEWYVRLSGGAKSLQAGEYQFDKPLNLPQVLDKLRRGLVYYYRVTIPEGLTLAEVAARLAHEGLGSKEAFLQAMQQGRLVGDLDPVAKNLEGYLFPETYFLNRTDKEEQMVRAMVSGFRDIWTLQRSQRVQELNLTTREVIILASMIEKEAAVAEERPLISAVFHNRLRKKINLACDSTVIYAVTLQKEYDGVIHQNDLELDSPYNTYLYPGLPPGPIANPGLESIDAALHPALVDYLYFVSQNNGWHFFSSNYRDHRRAVQRHQR